MKPTAPLLPGAERAGLLILALVLISWLLVGTIGYVVGWFTHGTEISQEQRVLAHRLDSLDTSAAQLHNVDSLLCSVPAVHLRPGTR
jgi:hypothetical protein